MKNNDQATSATAKPKRNEYTPQFKEQTLERTKQDGVPKVAKDLVIARAMLYSWQAKSRQPGQSFEEQKLQQAEILRLKRENARLEEEVAFLKRRQRIYALWVLCQAVPVRYAMMQSLEAEFPLCRCATVFRFRVAAIITGKNAHFRQERNRKKPWPMRSSGCSTMKNPASAHHESPNGSKRKVIESVVIPWPRS